MQKLNFSPKLFCARGQSLVEFGLILPILVFFLLGIFDLGYAIFAKTIVADVAREGARSAAVRSDSTNIYSDTLPYIASTGVGIYSTNSNIFTYTITGLPLTPGAPVTVTVNYTFTALTPFIGSFLGTNGKLRLSSSSAMIVE